MATASEPRFTPEEYLARERAAIERKSEYIDGRIYAMGGASMEHNQIVTNLARELGNRLQDHPCDVLVNDMRVKVDETTMYTYPDVVVVCGEPVLEDEHFDTLMNPEVIIEVLSRSTERYDRGDKWGHYQRIEPLQTYVLVAQDRVGVDMFTREGDYWRHDEVNDVDAVLRFESLGVSLPLTAIYRRVNFKKKTRIKRA